MNQKFPAIGLLCATTFLSCLDVSAGITAVNGGTVEWNSAGWTDGVPAADDAAFINDIAKVLIIGGAPAVAEGIRIGNVVPQIASLQMEGSSLETGFIVIGDAADSNAIYTQAGGKLTIHNTDPIDFELGNPFNTAVKKCLSLATFAAGEADLGDIRFNLRAKRSCRMVVFGILPVVRGATLSFETAGEKQWNPGELCFILSDAGVAPVRLSGELRLGSGDKALLQVDGAKYAGADKEFILLEAGSVSGEFKEIKLTGFADGARVAVEDNRVVLRLP